MAGRGKRKRRRRTDAEAARPRNPLVPVVRRLGHKTVPPKRREARPAKHKKRIFEED